MKYVFRYSSSPGRRDFSYFTSFMRNSLTDDLNSPPSIDFFFINSCFKTHLFHLRSLSALSTDFSDFLNLVQISLTAGLITLNGLAVILLLEVRGASPTHSSDGETND
jgi:hypothetical protein